MYSERSRETHYKESTHMKYIIATALIIITGYVSGYSLKTTNAQIDMDAGTMDGRCPMCPMDNISTSTCPYMTNVGTSTEQMRLNQDMRKLWSDHIIWTGKTVMSILDDTPGQDEITARLLKNPSDMAEIIRTYYGDEVASRFENLMKEHLTIAAELVKAAKAGDEGLLTDTDARWHANADQIADLLSQANANWPREEVRSMLYEHLDLLKKSVGHHMSKNIPESMANFDSMYGQALEMADAMSNGIIKQYPEKF